jgi:hypothetical protein
MAIKDVNIKRRGKFPDKPELDSEFDNLVNQVNAKTNEIIAKVNEAPAPDLPLTRVADGTYTVGIGGTTNGTITVSNGIITAIQEAVA